MDTNGREQKLEVEGAPALLSGWICVHLRSIRGCSPFSLLFAICYLLFMLNRDSLLGIVRPLLECPTAPMFESAVRAEIERQLRGVRGLELQADQYGNLIAWYGGGRPKYAFVAHMDHPGWQLRPVRRFLGGVPESLQDKGQVREFGEFGMWDLPAFS